MSPISPHPGMLKRKEVTLTQLKDNMAQSGAAETTQGPMVVGFIFNVFLLGVVTTQCYIYATTYKRDKLWIKCYVSVLYLLNILNTVFITIYLYTSLIKNFGDAEYLTHANWVFATDPVLTGIIATQVQIFFAWRVKVLTRNVWMGLIVAALGLAGLGGSVASTAGVLAHPAFAEFQVFKSKHKTGFEASDLLVDRIIRLTVQTGAVTSLCAIIDLILFLVDPSGLHLIFNFALAKLYTNTLMSSLNSRQGWAFDSMTNSNSQKTGPTSGGLATQTIGGTSSNKKSNNVVRVALQRPEVFVHVESHELQDVMTSRTIPGDLEAGSETEIDSKTVGAEYDGNSWHDSERKA
ncbi:hypothetical protein PM082_006049 [Marasmius tenuissimus]|nr:hypothetical protein PM082_006049 [Marasmius tenuissimus]